MFLRLCRLNKRLFSAQQLTAPKKYTESYNRSRNIMNLFDLHPTNQGFIFVAPNATIVGEVIMGSDIAVWHGTVIRGDINKITLVKNISIGSNCVLHTAASSPTGLGAELLIKGNAVIRDNCTLYSCTIDEEVYIGQNSVILQGAIIQKGAIIAPNSVVPPGRIVKERQVWGGNPIKYLRKAKEQQGFVTLDYARYSNHYTQLYNGAFLPFKNAYLYRQGTADPIDKYVTIDAEAKYELENRYEPTEATINRN